MWKTSFEPSINLVNLVFNWFKQKSVINTIDSHAEVIETFENPAPIFKFFTLLTGITFEHKEAITTTKLIHFCRNNGIKSFKELHSKLLSDSTLLEALINLLSVNETYFFREVGQIDLVCDKIKKNHLIPRILCAPGSSGEEPYSIAITLLENGINQFEIVSLDINSEATSNAKKGCYTPRSVHKTPPHIIERYFMKRDNTLILSEEVKKNVLFYTLNIFDDTVFDLGKFDYIFSRNMLIYFDIPTVIRTIERLCLMTRSENTLLFFGHADILTPPPFLVSHYEHGIKYYTHLSH